MASTMSFLSVKPLFFVTLLFTCAAFAYDFVGSESCQTCHLQAYSVWQKSAHSRAKQSLSETQANDVRCLTCHSPNESEKRVANVSCETCHGGGQFYTPTYVMKDSELVRLSGLIDPSEKQCKSCHDASSPSLKPFNFQEKLKLIDHWSQDKAKRTAKATQ